MTKQTFINEQTAVDYLFNNTDGIPEFKTKEEYIDFLEKNVYMNVHKYKNGREGFMVEVVK